MKNKNNEMAIKERDTSADDIPVIPKFTDHFDPDKVHLVFRNLRRKNKNFLGGSTLILSEEKTGNKIAELYLFAGKQWRFMVFNSDEKIKTYETSMPYETFKDFSKDLKRIDIKLCPVEEAV